MHHTHAQFPALGLAPHACVPLHACMQMAHEATISVSQEALNVTNRQHPHVNFMRACVPAQMARKATIKVSHMTVNFTNKQDLFKTSLQGSTH